jgi:hypothetical protein
MSGDSAGVLKHLFAIPQKQIDADIADADRDFDRMMEETSIAHKAQRRNQDPEATARFHHMQMVRAKALQVATASPKTTSCSTPRCRPT